MKFSLWTPGKKPTDEQDDSTAYRMQKAPESAEWWINPIRWIALAVFLAVPLGAPFAQSYAGRVVWTVVVAALPLFIVLVGYHRWRRICPLSFFAQLPSLLGAAGKRKAPAWLQRNYYYLACGIFFVSLWIRLIATNGDGVAIATFFILLTLIALAFGFLFTGKTWCNYVCPLSFIEKIYTEPHGLRDTPNSQCEVCTACKRSCPDINEENGYWKELESPPKRVAYFVFPGLVFGFYFYYFLQSGTWRYYFSGEWTKEPKMYASAFFPGADAYSAGLFFFPAVPRALAAGLTLLICGLASFLIFSAVERFVKKPSQAEPSKTKVERARHVTFSLAAFTAFVTFYTFAGAPTLWKLPWAVPHIFLIVVVTTATITLIRRLPRTQKRFAEETLARNILKRWEWKDVESPKDLREAFYIHTIRVSERAKATTRILEIYQEAVRETLANGFATRDDIQKLEQLRKQLQITKTDHEKVMASLAEDERARLHDPTRSLSAEKRLQLESYARALENYLTGTLAAEADAKDRFINRLRSEYQVTKEEHEAILDTLLGGSRDLTARLAERLRTLERATQALESLQLSDTPANDFMSFLVRQRRESAIDRLLNALGYAPESEPARETRQKLCALQAAQRQSGVEQLRRMVSPLVAEGLLDSYREALSVHAISLTDLLKTYTASVDPYIRATALYLLWQSDSDSPQLRQRLAEDEHELVRETAHSIESHRSAPAPATQVNVEMMTLQKMIALRSTEIFSQLTPPELADLAHASFATDYCAGEILCNAGEDGNEVFIVLSGTVKVMRHEDAGDKVMADEKAGGLLGEMAVLDPAPRAATILAGEQGARVLHLAGDAFRAALNNNPAIASGVFRLLVHRLRGSTGE